MTTAAEPAPGRARRRRRALRLASVLALFLGVALLGSALLQPVKAALGLALLDDAFEARRAAPADARADPENWRPWPWAEIAPIGRIAFPRLGESRTILDGVGGEALAWGVGHAPATAGLGAPGVTALAGHRDGAFAFLGRLEEGDLIELTPLEGAPIRYRVTSLEVIDARHRNFPIVRTGPDALALATCWPIEALVSGPERLLVTARRVD